MLAITGLLGAGCETQDCPEADASVDGSVFVENFSSDVDTTCEVMEVRPAAPYIAALVICNNDSVKSILLRTSPVGVLPIAVGQAIRVRAREARDGGHSQTRVEVEDAATSRLLILSIVDHDLRNDTSTAFEDLDLAPFSFGNELACRPVPGTRGDVRLAFDVTLEDQTLRLFDQSSARLGDYTLWIAAGTDGQKRIIIIYTP